MRKAPANRIPIPPGEIAPFFDSNDDNAKRRFDAALIQYYSALNVELLRDMAARPLEELQPDIFQDLARSKADYHFFDDAKVLEAGPQFYASEPRFS